MGSKWDCLPTPRDTGWLGGQRQTPAKRMLPQAPGQEQLSIPHRHWASTTTSSGLGSAFLPHQGWDSFSFQEISRGRGMELARGRIPTTISCQAQKYSSPHQARDFPSPTQKHQEALPQKISAAPQAEAARLTPVTPSQKNTTTEPLKIALSLELEATKLEQGLWAKPKES